MRPDKKIISVEGALALLASAAAIVGVLVVGGNRTGREISKPGKIALATADSPQARAQAQTQAAGQHGTPPPESPAKTRTTTPPAAPRTAVAPPRAVSPSKKSRVRRNAGPLAWRVAFENLEPFASPRWAIPPRRLLGLSPIVLHSDYVPFYFDTAPDMSGWDSLGEAGEVPRHEETARLEPASGPNSTPAPSLWNVGFSSDSNISYDYYGDAYTTRTPVVLSLQRSLRLPGLDSLRPHLRLGAGMLRQTAEVHDMWGSFTREEYIPLLRAGLGAEWHPSENFRILLRYEYSRLTSESSLNPSLPNQEHSIQTGIEVRF